MRPGRLGSVARMVGFAAGVVALAALTVLVGFVLRHRDATPVTVTAAQAEFDRLRARFAGQTALVDMDGDAYFVPPYVGGRGWLGVRLDVDEIDWDEISEIVTDAYREIAPKKLVTQLDQPRTS